MQDIKEKSIESTTDKENQEKQKKCFSDTLRKKYHEYKKDCSLAQLTKLDKNIKSITDTIEGIF